MQIGRREVEEARAQGLEHGERTRRECELVESRTRQSHQAEKDALVKEYEGII